MNRKKTAALLTAAALFAALLGGCADNTPTNIVTRQDGSVRFFVRSSTRNRTLSPSKPTMRQR